MVFFGLIVGFSSLSWHHGVFCGPFPARRAGPNAGSGRKTLARKPAFAYKWPFAASSGKTLARVAELADAPGLGPGPERGAGSSPASRSAANVGTNVQRHETAHHQGSCRAIRPAGLKGWSVANRGGCRFGLRRGGYRVLGDEAHHGHVEEAEREDHQEWGRHGGAEVHQAVDGAAGHVYAEQ